MTLSIMVDESEGVRLKRSPKEGVRLKRSPKEKTEGYEKVQIVHVDNLPSPVAKKDVKLTFPKKSKVLQHLEQKDRTTLEVMIEKGTAGTIMWSSSELTVSVEHAVKKMTEGDVSDHVPFFCYKSVEIHELEASENNTPIDQFHIHLHELMCFKFIRSICGDLTRAPLRSLISSFSESRESASPIFV